MDSRSIPSSCITILVGMMLLIPAAHSQVSICLPPPADLVGWWRAEGNANDAVGSNNGTVHPGASLTCGLVGQAFEFTGTSDSYVEVPDAPSLRAPDAVTIEFWVKRLSLDFSTHPADYILEKGGDWTGGVVNYGAALHNPQYNYCLHFTFAGGWRGGGTIADTNNWHHCAIVARNGDSDPTLYVDGVQQPVIYSQGAGTITLYPSTKPLHIGAQLDPATGFNYFGRTLVDELSIYDRALTSDEIQAIYNASAVGKCPPSPPACVTPPADLVGWWRAEGNANDAVGSNNGTVHPGASFTCGLAGQAFEFTGASDSYVEVPDAPALRAPDAVTIEFWVKRLSLDFSAHSADYILEKGGDWTGGVANYGVGLHNPQYNYCLHFTFAGGWRGGGSISDINNWHHCAIVARNGDTDPALYVDGVQQPVVYSEGSGTINLYPSTQPLHIGAQLDPATGWYYFGRTLLDELSIYNRALTPDEIQAIYNAGTSGKCLVDRPPQAQDFLTGTLEGEGLNIPISQFMLHASAPNGDQLSLTSVSSPSHDGMPVLLGTVGATYSPAVGYTGQDSFAYTVSNAHGGTASATVFVLVEPTSAAAATVLPPVSLGAEGLQLSYAGYPDRAYTIQRAESLTGPWLTLGTAATAGTGQAAFTDFSPPPVTAYYRAVYH